MNKFEQVSSDHHQMSLAGWRQDQGGPRSDVGGGGKGDPRFDIWEGGWWGVAVQ